MSWILFLQLLIGWIAFVVGVSVIIAAIKAKVLEEPSGEVEAYNKEFNFGSFDGR